MRTTLLRSPFNYHNPAAVARREQPNASGMRLALTLVVALLLTSLMGLARASTGSGDPMTFVKDTVGQILNVLQDKQTPQQARARKVIEIVNGRLDFSAMARSSLGYNWKKLTPDQQQQFVPLFTAFMEDAYISKISNYSGQKVQYVGQTSVGNGDAEVKTVVMPADASQQPIRINYMLSQTSGDWKVYDVTVDDISITANYRNQFNHMINEQGFDALMSAMRDKQQELRQSIGA
jgi:phospholipid transport system substrate-binding protein